MRALRIVELRSRNPATCRSRTTLENIPDCFSPFASRVIPSIVTLLRFSPVSRGPSERSWSRIVPGPTRCVPSTNRSGPVTQTPDGNRRASPSTSRIAVCRAAVSSAKPSQTAPQSVTLAATSSRSPSTRSVSPASPFATTSQQLVSYRVPTRTVQGVVCPRGFEPLTFCSGGKRSIQAELRAHTKTNNHQYTLKHAPFGSLIDGGAGFR
jgi:hypothetical protein